MTDKTVYRFQKNATESVFFSFGEYLGHPRVDIRTYYEAEDGTLRPTKKGVSIPLSLFDELMVGIRELEKELGR